MYEKWLQVWKKVLNLFLIIPTSKWLTSKLPINCFENFKWRHAGCVLRFESDDIRCNNEQSKKRVCVRERKREKKGEKENKMFLQRTVAWTTTRDRFPFVRVDLCLYTLVWEEEDEQESNFQSRLIVADCVCEVCPCFAFERLLVIFLGDV